MKTEKYDAIFHIPAYTLRFTILSKDNMSLNGAILLIKQ